MNPVETKSFDLLEVKTFDDEPGRYQALVSVYENVDHGGDIVEKGAFDEAIQAKAERGGKYPCVWDHHHREPPIGVSTLESVADGVLQDTHLFVGKSADGVVHQRANEVYLGLKHEAITQHSFAYLTHDYRMEQAEGKSVRRLTRLEPLEAGPTLFGMNPATRTIDPPKSLAALKASYGSPLDYLMQMIGAGTSYLEMEGDAADVDRMRQIVQDLLNLAKKDIQDPVVPPANSDYVLAPGKGAALLDMWLAKRPALLED